MTLTELRDNWQDVPAFHQSIHEHFTSLVNTDESLKMHRDWCDQNFHGLGERSFGWVWKQICQSLPGNPALCEIGVLRGQIISLWRLLRPDATVIGITPLDSSGNVWESDYKADIAKIHDEFRLVQPIILHGYSQDAGIVKQMSGTLLNVLYIDGSHQYQDVVSDFDNYAGLVVHGGWMVIDDACTDMKQWWGAFQGLEEVTRATLEFIEKHGNDWEFYGNCMHLRIYRRK